MFEFHGWAVILPASEGAREEDELVHRFRAQVAEMENCARFISWGSGFNGMHSFTVTGLRNHRKEEVIDLFRWLAENGPGSYGLLHVCDDEDGERGADYANGFRVWRLARGRLTEHTDPFLSPRIPTVEDPYNAALDP